MSAIKRNHEHRIGIKHCLRVKLNYCTSWNSRWNGIIWAWNFQCLRKWLPTIHNGTSICSSKSVTIAKYHSKVLLTRHNVSVMKWAAVNGPIDPRITESIIEHFLEPIFLLRCPLSSCSSTLGEPCEWCASIIEYPQKASQLFLIDAKKFRLILTEETKKWNQIKSSVFLIKPLVINFVYYYKYKIKRFLDVL